MSVDGARFLRVFKKLVRQSWMPFLLSIAYATWDFLSTQAEHRTAAGFIKTFCGAFFLIMWFVGQWFRADKQLADSEELGTLRQRMDDSLRMLQELTDRATENGADVRMDAIGIQNSPLENPNPDSVARVIAEVSKSPKSALLVLGAEIERELRELLWSSGWIQGVGRTTISKSVQHLVRLGVVSNNLGSSVSAFLDIRNRLLHGYGVTDDEILRAIDIGLTILRAVLAIPRAVNRVVNPGVEVYEDSDCRHPRAEVKGIVLRTQSPGGSSHSFQIFPVTKTALKEGQRVSWEWNLDFVIGPSWYRDLESGQVVQAWGQSAEFVGRNLDDV